MGKLFTSESVTEGHPDKIADQISDAILDELLAQDPYSRVAAETTVATGLALVVGEITTKAYVDIAKVAKQTIKEIGYVNNVDGYNADSIAVLTSIDEQSADIALGVDKAYESKQEGVTEDFGTVSDDRITEIIEKVFDLRPAAIISALDLRRPIYKQTAAYGHFGRTDVDLPWEHLDKVDDIKELL